MAVEVNVSLSCAVEALADKSLCAAADSSCQQQQDMLAACMDAAACSDSSSVASEPQQHLERIHRRSASCSAIMEQPSSTCLPDSSLSGSHVDLEAVISTPAAAADRQEKRQHKHRHRHHQQRQHPHQQHKQLALMPLPAGDGRAPSPDGHSPQSSRPSSNSSSRSSSPGFIAVVDNQRPRSFTTGTQHSAPHHLTGSSAPHHLTGSTAAAPPHHSHGSSSSIRHYSACCHAASSRGSSSKHQSSSPRKQRQQQVCGSNAAAAGRRAPLQQVVHNKHLSASAFNGGSAGCGGGAASASKTVGHAAAGVHVGSGGSSTAVVGSVGSGGGRGLPAGQLPPQVRRVMSEGVKPEAIAKGFAGNWLSRRRLDVFTGVRAAAPAEVMRRLLPSCPGLHLWLVRPPRSRHWVPVQLRAADSLRQGAGQYLHDDGSVGPSGEPSKYRVLLDLMCRGFAVQARFRPVKARVGSLAEDLRAKLARYDFPLNDESNGGCRPIELPNGWPVNEYPIICGGMNELYEELFGPRRMLL